MDGDETRNTITILIFGMLIGSWVCIVTDFMLGSWMWLIALAITGIVYLFYKFFKHYEQTGAFGGLSMLLILIGLELGGLISTYLSGGL